MAKLAAKPYQKFKMNGQTERLAHQREMNNVKFE